MPFAASAPTDLAAGRTTTPPGPPPSPALSPAPQPARYTPRWSLDSWLLWRPGGGKAGAALPSYGASQTGAVLRYSLAERPTAPYAYLRAAAALAGAAGTHADADLAVGLGLRPLAAVPLRAQLEVRLDRLGTGKVHGRAAAMAVTELPPLPLPGRGHAELYAQAGYVAGKAATGFLDAALRLDRPLATIGPAALLAGAVLSGGAERGAGRLDLGPAMTLALDHGPLHGRAALEYRMRVAGQARPGTGPALTITAGF
jgi:hypothetical protein